MSGEKGFRFDIKRPGQHRTTVDPKDWALYLPHQCDEWVIGYGDHTTTLAAAKRFRAELDAAISELENAQ